MDIHTKKCNLKGNPDDKYYSRKELEKLVEEKLGMKRSNIRRLSKKILCELLEIEWVDPVPKKTVISDEKLCTDRNCRSVFPNRVSKLELIERTKKKFPHYSKSQLSKMRIKDLCDLLRIRFVKCPPVVSPVPKPKPLPKPLELGTADTTKECIKRSKITLQPHQIRVVNYLDNHRGIIIYHKVGSGKTLTAITISQCFLDKHPDYKVIVITPASLIGNFKTQMKDYGNIKFPDHYEFYSFQEFVRKSKDKSISCTGSLLIIDEAHNLKTPYKKLKKKILGITSKKVIECAKDATKIIALTATPITNSVVDAMNLYNLIKEPTEPLMVQTKNVGVNQINYSKENLLRLLRNRISIFNNVDHANYPKKIVHNEFLVMTPSYEKKYNELMKEDALSELAIENFGAIDIAAFYNGFRRAVNNLEDEESPKIQWVIKKLKTLKPDEKTIIFSNFLDAGNKAIIKHLPEFLIDKYEYINGSISKNKRTEIVRRYNNNEILVLFISKAGGEGLDLKGTKNIILLEPSWNYSTEEQVIGRGIRYKSHHHLPEQERYVNVYHLYLIKPSDKKFLKKNEKDEIVVMNHTTNSIDLLLYFLARNKERNLDIFRKELAKYSI